MTHTLTKARKNLAPRPDRASAKAHHMWGRELKFCFHTISPPLTREKKNKKGKKRASKPPSAPPFALPRSSSLLLRFPRASRFGLGTAAATTLASSSASCVPHFALLLSGFSSRAARSAAPALGLAPFSRRLVPFLPSRHYAKSRKMPPKKAVVEEKIPLGRPGNSLKSGIVSRNSLAQP